MWSRKYHCYWWIRSWWFPWKHFFKRTLHAWVSNISLAGFTCAGSTLRLHLTFVHRDKGKWQFCCVSPRSARAIAITQSTTFTNLAEVKFFSVQKIKRNFWLPSEIVWFWFNDCTITIAFELWNLGWTFQI